jgi:crotonobetainyl-CoA:carnitine CoA-transferase CaiB-like acyl-CoA transferase
VFSRTPGRILRSGPGLGEHNQEVFASLGLDASELEELQRRQVV